jgi:hypothetical protein
MKVLCYLGVFFMPTLDWKPHATIMSNCAHSSVIGMQVLGNSIRGVVMGTWRKLYNAVILPILTYGSPVWFTDRKQLGVINTLQIAQNHAMRAVSGCFRTTPINAMEHMCNVPPIRFRLRHLHRLARERLARLPDWALLCNPDAFRRVTGIHRLDDVSPPFPLILPLPPNPISPTNASPPMGRVRKHPHAMLRYQAPSHPAERVYKHPCTNFFPLPVTKEINKTTCMLLESTATLYIIFLRTETTPNRSAFFTHYFSFTGDQRHHHGICRGDSRAAAELGGAINALRRAPEGSKILLLSRLRAFSSYATNTQPRHALAYSKAFQRAVHDTLTHPNATLSVRWYSKGWEQVKSLGVTELGQDNGTSILEDDLATAPTPTKLIPWEE